MENSTKIILGVLAIGVIAYVAFVFDGPYSDKADDFATCVGMGNPVMESYPRQCRDADGNLYVEDITVPGTNASDSVRLNEDNL